MILNRAALWGWIRKYTTHPWHFVRRNGRNLHIWLLSSSPWMPGWGSAYGRSLLTVRVVRRRCYRSRSISSYYWGWVRAIHRLQPKRFPALRSQIQPPPWFLVLFPIWSGSNFRGWRLFLGCWSGGVTYEFRSSCGWPLVLWLVLFFWVTQYQTPSS